jgi:hypothetical protein
MSARIRRRYRVALSERYAGPAALKFPVEMPFPLL